MCVILPSDANSHEIKYCNDLQSQFIWCCWQTSAVCRVVWPSRTMGNNLIVSVADRLGSCCYWSRPHAIPGQQTPPSVAAICLHPDLSHWHWRMGVADQVKCRGDVIKNCNYGTSVHFYYTICFSNCYVSVLITPVVLLVLLLMLHHFIYLEAVYSVLIWPILRIDRQDVRTGSRAQQRLHFLWTIKRKICPRNVLNMHEEKLSLA